MIIGIVFGILAAYGLLILSLSYGFWKLPNIKQQELTHETAFSVIVPFRNESLHLPNLLASIKSLEYPTTKVSFYFVDDASEDDSCEIIEKFSKKHPSINIRVLKNKRVSNSPKKDAIRTAITQLDSDWIVTTDADCIVPPKWLQLFNQEIILKRPNMIVAPVTYKEETSFFSYFQLLDFLSLQGTTIGSFGLEIPFMCNGANLSYKKKAFLAVQGFAGNDTIASGDDVFLLEKFIQKWPKKITYLKSKEAIITTVAVATHKELISQRVRWASKSANYNILTGKLIGVLVVLINLTFCVSPIFLFVGLSWEFILLFIVSKIGIDSILLFQTLRFTQQTFKLLHVLCSAVLYPFFTIFIFFRSLFSSYTWKNRSFKK
ncbi:glycosyltransferase family 2 protein [Kordia sp.]|uniref:glycosyltransferase family 2 protein n=1 Tax=Kordia sp. TaxID=1965332 RepID=UPI003B5A2385